MTPLLPLDLPTDLAEHGGHGGGGILALVLAVLVATFLFLRHRGLLPTTNLLGTFGARARPEESAKQILAERFAHGDLTAEEFMERASALNWTPGVEVLRPRSLAR